MHFGITGCSGFVDGLRLVGFMASSSLIMRWREAGQQLWLLITAAP